MRGAEGPLLCGDVDYGDFAAACPPVVHVDTDTVIAMDPTRQRLVLVGAAFLFAFVALAIRLIQITAFGGALDDAAQNGPPPSPSRAEIVDRNGQMLVTNLKVASLYANPREIWDVDEAVTKLARIFPEVDAEKLRVRLSGDRQFEWIKRDLAPREREAVYALGLPGFHFMDEPRRFYVQGRTLSHVLGFVDPDNHGLAGLERKLDKRLASGNDATLALSIDLGTQHALRDELAASMKEFSAIGAAGIVMDANNGEVLALVSLPDFDPTNPGEADPNALFNRATLGVFEMGSTFKILTTAFALNSGKVTLNSRFDATHPIHAGGFTISDYHAENRWLTVPEIFIHSSNIGSAKMVLDVGVDAHRAFLKTLGLFERPGIEIEEVGAPLVPSPWREITGMTVAFGHGMAVSPVNLVKAVAAMVNGGHLIEPTLLKHDPGAKVPSHDVIAGTTSEEVRTLMRRVVTEGTGRQADVPGYSVGGKTGTAEKVVNGAYKKNALMSSFVAIFPSTAPRYVVYVVLDEPKGTEKTYGFATAGWTAAPTAARVITRIAPILRVPPVEKTDVGPKAAKKE